MVGLDTNVLLRYILQDDPAQSKSASSLVENLSKEEPGYVNLITLAEVAWTLRTRYTTSSLELASTLERLLNTDRIRVQMVTLARAALQDVRAGHASFPDALITHINAAAGCKTTVTFDQRATRHPGFVMLGEETPVP